MKPKSPKTVEIANILHCFSQRDLCEYLLESVLSELRTDKSEAKYLSAELKRGGDIWVDEFERELAVTKKQVQFRTHALKSLKEAAVAMTKVEKLWEPKPKKKSPKKSSKTG